MSHMFCSDCGVKIEYNFAKPNFCSKCGANFGSVGQSNARVAEPARKKVSAVSDDETDAEFVPDIRGLDVEIYNNKSFTIGSLAGQNTPPDFKGKGSYGLDEFTSNP